MITLFSVPKPMEGEFRVLQENAVGSWRALGADVEILLLGDEPGVAQCASRNGARYLPDVARNEFGTPRVDDIFRRAEQAATERILCYINADILLGKDFLAAVRVAAEMRAPFLIPAGRRKSATRCGFEGAWKIHPESTTSSSDGDCGGTSRRSPWAAQCGTTG
jgi:hypothetical protein